MSDIKTKWSDYPVITLMHLEKRIHNKLPRYIHRDLWRNGMISRSVVAKIDDFRRSLNRRLSSFISLLYWYEDIHKKKKNVEKTKN